MICSVDKARELFDINHFEPIITHLNRKKAINTITERDFSRDAVYEWEISKPIIQIGEEGRYMNVAYGAYAVVIEYTEDDVLLPYYDVSILEDCVPRFKGTSLGYRSWQVRLYSAKDVVTFLKNKLRKRE